MRLLPYSYRHKLTDEAKTFPSDRCLGWHRLSLFESLQTPAQGRQQRSSEDNFYAIILAKIECKSLKTDISDLQIPFL